MAGQEKEADTEIAKLRADLSKQKETSSKLRAANKQLKGETDALAAKIEESGVVEVPIVKGSYEAKNGKHYGFKPGHVRLRIPMTMNNPSLDENQRGGIAESVDALNDPILMEWLVKIEFGGIEEKAETT